MSNVSLNLTDAAFLSGRSLATISRAAREGKLGPIVYKGKRPFVSRAAVEQYRGRSITDAELQTVRDRHSHRQPYLNSEQAFEDAATLAAMDPGTAAYYSDWRDTEWIDHLRKLGITVPSPPAFGPAQPVLDLQNFFTRRQVEQLIANALEQRDREWRDWANSGVVDQALNPHGPLSVNQKPL